MSLYPKDTLSTQRFACIERFARNIPRFFVLLIILSPLGWYGCTFAPEEDFFNEIKPIDSTRFTISLNEFDDLDTIYLEGPATFTYSLSCGSGQLQQVRVLLNGYVMETLSQPSGSFTINPSTGIFPMRLEFISTTGSGSLIDQAGGEHVQVWKEWTIKAYVETPPEKPVITQSIENGYLTIRWTPYTRTKFIRYHLQRENGTSLYFTDPTITSWVDSTYTGFFTRRYWVNVETQVGTSSDAITATGNGNLAVQASFRLEDSTISITFPKPKYWGTFKEHTIKQRETVITRITDPEATTYSFKTDEVGLNYSTIVQFSTLSKAPAIVDAHWSGALSTTVPTLPFPRVVENFSYNTDLNAIMASASVSGMTRLFQINPETLTFTDSVDIYQGPGYHVPYRGQHVYYSQPKELVQRNLVTGVEQRINAIITPSGSGPSVIRGSGAQIASYAWFGPPSSGTGVNYYSRVYNMATGKQLAYASAFNTQMRYAISDDGNYATLNNIERFRVGANELTQIGHLGVAGTWLGFRLDKCEEMLSVSGSTVYVYSSETGLQLRAITAPPFSSLVTYDVVTKYLIFNNQTNRKFYSIHIDTGEQREANINLGGNGFTVINDNLIINSRQYLKLFE